MDEHAFGSLGLESLTLQKNGTVFDLAASAAGLKVGLGTCCVFLMLLFAASAYPADGLPSSDSTGAVGSENVLVIAPEPLSVEPLNREWHEYRMLYAAMWCVAYAMHLIF